MNNKLKLILKILATISIIVIGGYLGLFLVVIGSMMLNILPWMLILPCLIIPSLLLILLWKRKKKIFKIWGISSLCVLIFSVICIGGYVGYKKYQESITINTSPNINFNKKNF